MVAVKSNVELLEDIAAALGTDVATIMALRELVACDAAPAAANPSRTILLHRLVRAFRALPADEIRLQAVQMLEALAAHASGSANEVPN